MGRTKKVGAAGRFGVRYGSTVKERWLAVEQKRKRKQRCPFCGRLGSKREAKGLWFCKICDRKFTGGAYALEQSAEQDLKTKQAKQDKKESTK
jgi:large subunit ribosomal protein L37Ae